MRTILSSTLDPGQLSRCDNCDRIVVASDLLGIEDIAQRLTPGGTTPSGECPVCGCLCYLITYKKP